MANRDLQLITTVCASWEKYIEKNSPDKKVNFHPLDKIMVENLNSLSKKLDVQNSDEGLLYAYSDDVKEIWKDIIERSIMCLRYFDKREPFIDKAEKIPVAYGIEDLMEYYDNFSEFESLLYGGSKYYRDHVIHAFRTWILGLKVLLDNNGSYLKEISVGDVSDLNCYEKVSIWSMISLMHDLGYPLEKAQKIIDKTKGMMHHFVSDPSVTANFAFSGVQNNINDFILRLMSSKMSKRFSCSSDGKCTVAEKYGNKTFVARLQPKYYFKFSKSLEKSKHGMISSIIIYKLLQYFFESDFSIDEDYFFDEEGARQFYIRREILRSIAAHTCHDIYHQKMKDFSYLLIIVDDSQDWGRKQFSDLYFGSDVEFKSTDISVKIGTKDKINETIITEKVQVEKEIDQLKHVLKSHYDLCQVYRVIFKDGLDTQNRDFILTKTRKIVYSTIGGDVEFDLVFKILENKNAEFKVTYSKQPDEKLFNQVWLEKTLGIHNSKFVTVVETFEGDKTLWSIEPNARFNY